MIACPRASFVPFPTAPGPVSPPTDAERTFREEVLPEMDAIYRFALRLAGSPAEAQDLVQETFLRAWKNRDAYTPGTRARSWLFTICRNVFLRGEERGRRHEEIVREQSGQAAGASEAATGDGEPDHAVFMAVKDRDPEGTFWAGVVDERILAAIDGLPGDFREVVVLSDLEGLSYREVAQVAGVPEGTVKSRLFRGRQILKKELHEVALEAGLLDRESPQAAGGGDR